MSEQAAFIRAICENPDDDTARLVYADWLQENGRESLAGFIRHQILTPVSPCRNAPLTALISLESLVGPYPHKYQTNVSGIGGATVTYPNGMVFWFTRGFVSCIELPCAALLTHAAAIFAQHPIESVRITDRNAAAYHHTLSDLPGDTWLLQWYRGYDFATGSNHSLPRPIIETLIERGGWLRVGYHEGHDEDYTYTAAVTPRTHTINIDYAFDPVESGTLSEACVAYGRKLASLPEWKPTTKQGGAT